MCWSHSFWRISSMANGCKHEHGCCNCGVIYICEKPECVELPGFQGACSSCSYKYGGAQNQDRHDWSAL